MVFSKKIIETAKHTIESTWFLCALYSLSVDRSLLLSAQREQLVDLVTIVFYFGLL